MSQKKELEAKISDITFSLQEYEKHYFTYENEIRMFNDIKNGDSSNIDQMLQGFQSNDTSHLSNDPFRNKRYLLITTTTMACRFAIEGGMEMQTAFIASDLFIQKADLAVTYEELYELYREMMTFYAEQVRKAGKRNPYSRPIQYALDYIHNHLHSRLTIPELCGQIHLTPAYFSSLFKKETGVPVAEYIRKKRIDAAQNLLKYSEYSYSEIGNYLAFSSYSHFATIFKKYTGMSPREYKMNYFRSHWE